MYSINVAKVKHGFKYTILYGEVPVTFGYRPSEQDANRDGREDLRIARLFRIAQHGDNE